MEKPKLEQLEREGRIAYTKSGFPLRKYYLEEMKGAPLQDIWTDIPGLGGLSGKAEERLGYQTQKPIALLKRIIEISTKEGDLVFDPFAGCGTAIYAAHLLKRRWIGCDIAILSVRLVRDALVKRYGLREKIDFEISGVPVSVEGAHDLFERDPRQFQHWAVELAGGFCNSKHSGDKGIDGRIYFDTQHGLQNMVISVKGGHLTPAFVRDLRGTLAREGDDEETKLAGFICLEPPTKGMRAESARAGQFDYKGVGYDRLQIRTIEDLLAGKAFDTPSRVETMSWEKQIPLPLPGAGRATRAPKRRGRSVPINDEGDAELPLLEA